MLFNSFSFLLFFVVVTPLYYLTGYRWRWLLLLIASCYFYASFIPAYLLVLFTIIGIDYIAGRCIEPATGKRRKAFLVLSLTANLGALALFKYYNFFIGNVNHLLALVHIQTIPFPLWHLALPLGLSFHTFQAMSYTLEVYKGSQKAERHLGIYALYVMFYPQLVAGPIERPAELLPQLHSRHPPDYDGIADGLKKMLIGFFMKVVVADRLGIYVNYIYVDPETHSRLGLLLAVFFFPFQIYCDFAGYSLIAIGAAKTMGITLAPNFRQPYLAASVRDFWRRWHMTLTRWFRDYLYFPMGGSRLGTVRTCFNLLVVFLLSGLWHGAAWTFVIWGLLHAIAVILESLTSHWKTTTYALGRALGTGRPRPLLLLFAMARGLLTFTFLCLTWIFFRAASASQAVSMIRRMLNPLTTWQRPEEFRERVLLICCFMGIACIIFADTRTALFGEKHLLLYHRHPGIRLAACTALIVLILLFGVFNASQFIYFQF
jgi:alginate O-acetyltransferase complex protein AlgI